MGRVTAEFRHYSPGTSETELADHSGQRVEVLGAVELDHDEFTMSQVRFADGHEADAFNDELSEWRLEA